MWLLLRIIGLYLARQQIICIVYPTVWVWHGIERPHYCTTFGNHGNHKSTTRLHAYITHIDFFFFLFFYFHLPFFSDATQIEPVDRYLNNQREKKSREREREKAPTVDSCAAAQLSREWRRLTHPHRFQFFPIVILDTLLIQRDANGIEMDCSFFEVADAVHWMLKNWRVLENRNRNWTWSGFSNHWFFVF